jgi:hypothetical protein
MGLQKTKLIPPPWEKPLGKLEEVKGVPPLGRGGVDPLGKNSLKNTGSKKEKMV